MATVVMIAAGGWGASNEHQSAVAEAATETKVIVMGSISGRAEGKAMNTSWLQAGQQQRG